MRRESDKIKISLRLFDGDREKLQKFYPDTPYAEVIRGLVTTHLARLEAKLQARVGTLPLPEPEEPR